MEKLVYFQYIILQNVMWMFFKFYLYQHYLKNIGHNKYSVILYNKCSLHTFNDMFLCFSCNDVTTECRFLFSFCSVIISSLTTSLISGGLSFVSTSFSFPSSSFFSSSFFSSPSFSSASVPTAKNLLFIVFIILSSSWKDSKGKHYKFYHNYFSEWRYLWLY